MCFAWQFLCKCGYCCVLLISQICVENNCMYKVLFSLFKIYFLRNNCPFVKLVVCMLIFTESFFFLPQIWYKWPHEEISAFPLHVCLYLIFAGAPWAVYSHITVVHWVAGHHRAVWLVPSVVRDPHPIPTGIIEYQCEMYENEQKNLQQSSIFSVS